MEEKREEENRRGGEDKGREREEGYRKGGEDKGREREEGDRRGGEDKGREEGNRGGYKYIEGKEEN